MVASSVRCRGKAVRLPPLRSENRSSSRAATSSTLSIASLAAASSMARGIPSSWMHTSTTAPSSSLVRRTDERASSARSAKRRTAS